MISSCAVQTLRRLGTSTSALSSTRWASTLVVSEPLIDGVTPPGTQATVTAAGKLGQPVELLVVGAVPPSKIPAGVSKVYHVAIADKLAESVANAIQAAVEVSGGETTVVMGTSSKFGSTVIPRAAALLNVSPITDILQIQDTSEYSIMNFLMVMVMTMWASQLYGTLFVFSFYPQKHLFDPCMLEMSWEKLFLKNLLFKY